MKTDYEILKDTCNKQGSALTASFKKNGEVLIYISPNADNEEVMKSLIQVSIEIANKKTKW